jgi:hypothetical protein
VTNQEINNGGSYHKSADIYYNCIQNLTINHPVDLEQITSSLRNNLQNPLDVENSKEDNISYNLSNMDMFNVNRERNVVLTENSVGNEQIPDQKLIEQRA